MLSRLMLLTLIMFASPVAAQAPQPGWIADAKSGCRVWNGNPGPNETISWTGGCPNGIAQGRGILQWFKDGKPNGRYEGEYRDGRSNGRGVYTFASGTRYEGEFRDGDFNGRGVEIFTNGRYDGEWRDSKRNGRGVLTFADGSRYDGEWRDGGAHGTGTWIADGNTYTGTWANGCFKQGNRTARVGATARQCGFD